MAYTAKSSGISLGIGFSLARAASPDMINMQPVNMGSFMAEQERSGKYQIRETPKPDYEKVRQRMFDYTQARAYGEGASTPVYSRANLFTSYSGAGGYNSYTPRKLGYNPSLN